MSNYAQFTPPFRYGVVNHHLHRGAYPILRNLSFLVTIKLRTIVSLVPEPPTADLLLFASMFNIEVIHIPVLRTASLASLVPGLGKAINVIVDSSFHPVYIHCLDGRRITGERGVQFTPISFALTRPTRSARALAAQTTGLGTAGGVLRILGAAAGQQFLTPIYS